MYTTFLTTIDNYIVFRADKAHNNISFFVNDMT